MGSKSMHKDTPFILELAVASQRRGLSLLLALLVSYPLSWALSIHSLTRFLLPHPIPPSPIPAVSPDNLCAPADSRSTRAGRQDEAFPLVLSAVHQVALCWSAFYDLC